MKDRNYIEKQAILALNTIATTVLFVFDPTLTSGYDIESQVELYKEIKNQFLESLTIPIKILINKIDMATPEEINQLLEKIDKKKENVMLVSAKDGENTDLVLKFLLDYFKGTNFRR